MLDSTAIESARRDAALLAAVSDPIRLAVLRRLANHGTRCVCDLQTEPPIAANRLSYHLKVLRECGLVTAERRGRWVDYTLAPDALRRLTEAVTLPAAREVTPA